MSSPQRPSLRMMRKIRKAVDHAAHNIWSYMLFILFAAGLWLTIRTRFIQFRRLGLETKYSEALSGVKFREKHLDGSIAGGFAGAIVKLGVQMGFGRGLLTNEAGLGSVSIAHAAAQTPSPVH
jgi:Na+/alanine symporter